MRRLAAPGIRPESGWRTHGSNGGDPQAITPCRNSSVSFLELSTSLSPCNNFSVIYLCVLQTLARLQVWVPWHTNWREDNHTVPPLPPAMHRHPGHYGGILHNEPREIQISRISVWPVMLSGEIPMAWLSSGPWSSIPSTQPSTELFRGYCKSKIVALLLIASLATWLYRLWVKCH